MSEALTGGLAVALVMALALLWAQRSEIRYLRGMLEAQKDHERRVERTVAGLPEVAQEVKPPDVPREITRTRIEQAIGAWASLETQVQLRSDVAGWRREGRDWEWIADELEKDLAQ